MGALEVSTTMKGSTMSADEPLTALFNARIGPGFL
jgi:hypothetical protein